MILQIKLPCFSLFLLLIPVLGAYGQGETNSKSADVLEPNLKRLHALMSTTPAYQDDVMRLLLAEANLVAKDLLLQETLPIEATNLVAKYIPPPQLAQRMGAIGNLTTSNYTYYFSVGNKFSFLTQTRLERGYAELRKQYLWPMSQVNTNGA